MTSTLFDKDAYDDGIRDAISKVVDDWGFRYPGIADVEHVYFYAVASASADVIQRYLDQTYAPGGDFDRPGDPVASRAQRIPSIRNRRPESV
jgi:NAD(P)H dehydrogenase (quinone)